MGRNRADHYEDTFEYSDDMRYRWWYERRWGDGPSLCWVGLNPSTGDTTGQPRPTLSRVVRFAEKLGLEAVIVVNLFSYRVTSPKELKRLSQEHDIAGSRTDDVIKEMSKRSARTLAAWGNGGLLLDRSAAITPILKDPLCFGITKKGEPRHPRGVLLDVEAVRYVRHE